MIKKGHQFVIDGHTMTYHIVPLGVYATQQYKPSDIIKYLHGSLFTTPSQRSICIGDTMYVEDRIGQYINHSLNPNTTVDGNKIVAIKDIMIHDEITLQYHGSQLKKKWPFDEEDDAASGFISYK